MPQDYETTTNYNLKKPHTDAAVDITLLNDNFDIIDTQMKSNNNAAIQAASSSQAGRMSSADYIKLNKQEIPANANLNNYTTPGMYYCNSTANAATLSNCPATQRFCMNVYELSETTKVQEIVEIATSNDQLVNTHRRIRYNTTWYSWDSFIRVSTTFANVRKSDTTASATGSVYRIGRVVNISFAVTTAVALTAGSWLVVGVLPAEYRPVQGLSFILSTTATNPEYTRGYVSENGNVSIKSHTSYAAGMDFSGTVTYFV